MPMIAMSAGSGAGSGSGSSAGSAASRSAAPSITRSCSSAIVPTRSCIAATCPIMNRPWRHCSSSSSSTSLGACGSAAKAGLRSTPFAAMRRRPMFSTSSRSRRSAGSTCSVSSRSRSAAKSSTNGDGRQRVACPGPLSSSTVCVPATAACWNAAVIAPPLTASSVYRYAVPMSTPIRTPRSASGAAIAAVIAADSPSWMPPANSTDTSGAAPAGSASSSAATMLSHSTKLVRGPTCPPHSRPSKTKRRAPSRRYSRSSATDGTCR